MELWDLYDKDKNLVGKTHQRGVWIPDGYYHLVVHVWIKNKNGEYLISRRSADRESYPLYWECPGGSVLKGEDGLQGARRETLEEVGVDLSNIKGTIINTKLRESFHDIMEAWLFNYDGDVDLSKATTKEVCEYKWMNISEIKELLQKGEFVPTLDYIIKIGDE